jgi:hypothetical protein
MEVILSKMSVINVYGVDPIKLGSKPCNAAKKDYRPSLMLPALVMIILD